MESLTNSHLLQWPPNAVKEIRKIYNLDKKGRIEEAVDILEKWVQKQEHFTKKDFNRGYLERSLVLCKGSVEKAKKQIDKLCTMKTLLPHFFSKTNAKLELKEVLNLGFMIPLPVMNKNLNRLILLKSNDRLKEEHITEFYQYSIILSEYLKAHEYMSGNIIVFDLRDINIMNLMTKINTVELQQFITILMEGYGVSVKGIYILTSSKAIELLVKLVTPFLSKKIANRIQVHKSLEELYNDVPKDLLPSDYGGKQKSSEKLVLEWTDELSTDEHVEYIKMMRTSRTNESLRRQDTFNEEYMGMPGSFRNLSVD